MTITACSANLRSLMPPADAVGTSAGAGCQTFLG